MGKHTIGRRLTNSYISNLLYEEIQMYLWSRGTRISRFAIVTMLSIPPGGAVSTWTTPVTPLALANRVSYDWVAVDMGKLIKNRGTSHQLSPLVFTASSAAKSPGEFQHSAKVILSHRQASIIKVIMKNGLWDSSHKLFSALTTGGSWNWWRSSAFSTAVDHDTFRRQHHFYSLSICRVIGSCPAV